MPSNKENIAASEYARIKIEEIRKKLGHYKPADNQAHKQTVIAQIKNQADKPRQALQPSNVSEQCENRIKNIDCINMKIKSALEIPCKISRPSISTPRYSQQIVMQSKASEVREQSQVSGQKQHKMTDFRSAKYAVSIQFETQQQQTQRSSIVTSGDEPQNSTTDPLSTMPTNTQHQKLQKQYTKQSSQTYTHKKSHSIAKQQKYSQNFKKKYEADQQNLFGRLAKKQTIKLATRLNQQIKRDQKLRQFKWQFSEWKQSDKWELFETKVRNIPYFPVKPTELRLAVQISVEEHNPFFQSTQVDETCLDSLIYAFEEAQKHWNSLVTECVSIESLEKQCFSIKDIDLNKRGEILTEDLVCFINLYTGSFFRNRDVISLYRRFLNDSPGKLSYEKFLDRVTSQ